MVHMLVVVNTFEYASNKDYAERISAISSHCNKGILKNIDGKVK